MCELIHYVYIPCYHDAATVLKYCDAVESCLRGDNDVVVRRRSFAQRRTHSEPILPTVVETTDDQPMEAEHTYAAWSAHATSLADAFSRCRGLVEKTKHIRLECDLGPHCPSLKDNRTRKRYEAYQGNLQVVEEEPEWVAGDKALREKLSVWWQPGVMSQSIRPA